MSDAALGRTAILVLGMHRSGTSAATRLANLMGAELGSSLLDGGPDNSVGFWEHVDVLQIHERLLAALGRDWADVRSMPAGWRAHPAVREARDALGAVIDRDFADAPLWAVKDPRMCRLVPLWLDLLSQRGIRPTLLFVVRHPDEVAASLYARNQCPPAAARLLWLQHLFEAEAETRDFARCLITYDALLQDHTAAAARIARDLQITWPNFQDARAIASLGGHLDRARQHHHAPAQPRSADMAIRAYSLCRQIPEQAQWTELSALGDAYAATFAVVEPALSERTDVTLPSVRTVHEANYADLAELLRRVGALEATFGWGSGAAGMNLNRSPDLEKADAEFDNLAVRGLNVDACALYFRGENQPYSEERSLRQAVAADDGLVRVEFKLPSDSPCDIVRFDPAETPGIFRVAGLYLDGERLASEQFRVVSLNGHPLPHEAALVRFSAPFIDPYVEIDLRGLRDSGAPPFGTVAVVFERETIRGHIVQALRAEQTRHDANILAACERQNADTRNFFAREMRRESDGLREVLRDVVRQESALNPMRAELDAIHRALEAPAPAWWQFWRRQA